MKIKCLRYQNFRNFADKGEIKFDIDGKVTIIYGENGNGKTTLHQLFQWILYNRVTFNKTTSPKKLYNLELGAKLTLERSFKTWGEIEFEHNAESYLVRREFEYYKQKNGEIQHKVDKDSFCILKRNSENDWVKLKNPELLIEYILPSGLSQYFFFDGETMIADLKIRGTDSAKLLRKALYSIFDLEAYEKALDDIGATSKSQTVLGQLESKRLKSAENSVTDEEQKKYLRDIQILKNRIENIIEENERYEKERDSLNKESKELSEKIGNHESRKALEGTRKTLKRNNEGKLKEIEKIQLEFGNEIENKFSDLLISEVVKNADKRLYMQVQDEEKKIIPGLTKELLLNLLKNAEIQNCICGRCIGDCEKKQIEAWKMLFPPESYKSTYDKFKRNTVKYIKEDYDKDHLFYYLKRILSIRADIKETENSIEEIDEALKKVGNIDELIEERKKVEYKIKDVNVKIGENKEQLNQFEHQRKIRERKIDNFEKIGSEIENYHKKILLMNQVADIIKADMNNGIREYSIKLGNEIKSLFDMMSTSKREIILNKDFQLQVKDSYGDESKSEGQFAVVSFAYIGGILKVLKNHEKLQGKEYPLVLDGPFSKLDPKQKENVIHIIPEYAPQVIMFSKDPLENYIEEKKVGSVWTIVSNAEKNNAEIKEGCLWN